ncbi:hypothetical protein PQI07_09115 [Methylobacterium sp. 092160098-2]|uniref:hypothetical protein n=1 Tax=Methylobacterium sp. 092160098-2 TaxID=3025129 RepID=UPI002381AD97|nr:hypothetical protein [Methylobacterium sp. 092160098-2]MDE4910858.1 hypothetical protein [Methylobacterium sp. 092160098-2]
MDGWRAWNATLGKPEGDPDADAAYERAAQRRDTLLDRAEALPATTDNVLAKALAICWLEYVSEVLPGRTRSDLSFTGRLALDIHQAIIGDVSERGPVEPIDWYAPPPGFMASPAIEPFSFARIPEGIAIELGRLRGIAIAEFERRSRPEMTAQDRERLRRELHLDVLASGATGRAGFAVDAGPPSLVGMLDLASATIDELRAVQAIAEHVGAMAYAYTWGPRCMTCPGPRSDSDYNDAGKLMLWLGDALTEVETAVDIEVARRPPGNRLDRETRLSMLAARTIDDGDPAAIRAFALELLDHAATESRGA